MASYLCVKMNSSATKSYNIKSSANKPYLRVDTGFIPLTTATATGPKLMVRAGGVNYRLADFITTTTAITTGTSYLTSQKTTGTSYETASRASTSGTGYESRSSTSATGYLTKSSTSSTGYLTRSSTSSTRYLTRASTSSTTYTWRSSTYSTTYGTRASTSKTTYGWTTYAGDTYTFTNKYVISTDKAQDIINSMKTKIVNITTNNSGNFLLSFSNSKAQIYVGDISSSNTSNFTFESRASFPLTNTNCKYGFLFTDALGSFSIYTNSVTKIPSGSPYTTFMSKVMNMFIAVNLKELSYTSSTKSLDSYTNNTILFDSAYFYTGGSVTRYYNPMKTMSTLKTIYYGNTRTKYFSDMIYSAFTFRPYNSATATSYQTRASTSTTGYLTRQSTSSTGYKTRASTYTTTYDTRSSTYSTTYATRSSTYSTTYGTRSSTSNTTYATRSSQYTSNTSYLTQSETYETSYITSSTETTIEG